MGKTALDTKWFFGRAILLLKILKIGEKTLLVCLYIVVNVMIGGPWPSSDMVSSWYDNSGEKMANGQVFHGTDKHLAAHKTLPFGAKVRLTNPSNGKSLIVEITDRGPFIDGRDIDVSRAAAKYLGFLKFGTATLEAEIVSYPASH